MKRLALTVLVALVAVACASRPVLPPRPAGNPAGVDLSGLWHLRAPEREAGPEEQTIVMPRGRRAGPDLGERGRDRDGKGSSVRLFLVSGTTLKVTQTDYGLFASFDRAVVEEVNFGENRIVSVGPIEAQRVAGWQGPTLIVETMDEEGSVLRESWHLDEGGDVLMRDILIRKGDKEQLAIRQLFDRREGG